MDENKGSVYGWIVMTAVGAGFYGIGGILGVLPTSSPIEINAAARVFSIISGAIFLLVGMVKLLSSGFTQRAFALGVMLLFLGLLYVLFESAVLEWHVIVDGNLLRDLAVIILIGLVVIIYFRSQHLGKETRMGGPKSRKKAIRRSAGVRSVEFVPIVVPNRNRWGDKMSSYLGIRFDNDCDGLSVKLIGIAKVVMGNRIHEMDVDSLNPTGDNFEWADRSSCIVRIAWEHNQGVRLQYENRRDSELLGIGIYEIDIEVYDTVGDSKPEKRRLANIRRRFSVEEAPISLLAERMSPHVTVSWMPD